MSRRVPSLTVMPKRLFAALLAVVLAVIPVPTPGPGGATSGNAAGPPAVEQLDGIPLVGEFAAAGGTVGHLVLTWDEILDPRFVPDGADFTITVNTVETYQAVGVELLFSGAASEAFAFGDDGLTFMRLDLPPGVEVGAGDSVQLDYVPGGTPVRDLALNAAPAFSGVEAIIGEIGSLDHLVTVVDSYHGADKVVVVLTEPVEETSLPAPSQFTVEVDTIEVPVLLVADLSPELGLAFLELTLDSPPVTDSSVPVIVDYDAQPGTLVSRYSGQTLGDLVDVEATVIIANNATSGSLGTGGSLSTASGNGPTPGDPLETTIIAAAPGDASITEGSVDFPSPPGYGFFGHQVVIEMDAPAPSAAMPHVLTFGIDASVIPPGQDETTVQIFRNGTLVPDCTDPGAGVAEPSPCVSERVPLGGGDIRLTVLTVLASTWNVGLLLPYEFDGFFAPIDNGVPNTVNAGRAIPVKFSLGGDRGLDIFADGSPYVRSVTCSGLEDGDLIEETVTAGQSGLQYDAGTDIYTYVWKTNRAWADTCRRLVLEFADGTVATAVFKFSR